MYFSLLSFYWHKDLRGFGILSFTRPDKWNGIRALFELRWERSKEEVLFTIHWLWNYNYATYKKVRV